MSQCSGTIDILNETMNSNQFLESCFNMFCLCPNFVFIFILIQSQECFMHFSGCSISVHKLLVHTHLYILVLYENVYMKIELTAKQKYDFYIIIVFLCHLL